MASVQAPFAYEKSSISCYPLVISHSKRRRPFALGVKVFLPHPYSDDDTKSVAQNQRPRSVLVGTALLDLLFPLHLERLPRCKHKAPRFLLKSFKHQDEKQDEGRKELFIKLILHVSNLLVYMYA